MAYKKFKAPIFVKTIKNSNPVKFQNNSFKKALEKSIKLNSIHTSPEIKTERKKYSD